MHTKFSCIDRFLFFIISNEGSAARARASLLERACGKYRNFHFLLFLVINEGKTNR